MADRRRPLNTDPIVIGTEEIELGLELVLFVAFVATRSTWSSGRGAKMRHSRSKGTDSWNKQSVFSIRTTGSHF